MRGTPCRTVLILALSASVPGIPRLLAQEPTAVIPHGQKAPPGPPLSPEQAVRKMTVPEGFTVEIVAAEPDLVNPVAMTFDDRGRIWVTESLEYPRSSPGPGRDRVKILEDTDGDGKADRFTVFADGLNIPSGIAVGHGGVWVANAPDILFLRDTDGDGKADTSEVVVTGFGRTDTHELPNSLTWGPDGWLYGWNGVFNHSHVRHRGKDYRFTCAIFRIHPETRDFELWCEGTSNPWGLAFDPEGSAFASACVIDHLWHLVETGYYHRQGGPYPPFTWKIDSIVDFKHQQAAYCGITYYDSDTYPAPFRDRLYMGNIHGNAINVDTLERRGSTYKAGLAPDFLQANDAWFMPVSQQTGPDGCLYILDWYDRYHCYQDARRDPEGIDRLKGRLYRVRYGEAPRAVGFDLSRESDASLVERLRSGNSYLREHARRLLAERKSPAANEALAALVRDERASRKARMNALWAMISAGPLEPAFHAALLADRDPGVRAWAVRAAGNQKRLEPGIKTTVQALAADGSPDVLLQVAIASRKIEDLDPLPTLTEVLANCGDDPLIPRVVWQNLHPLLEDRGLAYAELVGRAGPARSANFAALLPRVIERTLGARAVPTEAVGRLLSIHLETRPGDPALGQALALIRGKLLSGELAGEPGERLRESLRGVVQAVRSGPPTDAASIEAELLAAAWLDPDGLDRVRALLAAAGPPDDRHLAALEVLAFARKTEEALEAARSILGAAAVSPTAASTAFRGRLLAVLERVNDPRVADIVLQAYATLEPENRSRAIGLLTERAMWARPLLEAIGRKQIPAEALGINQVRKLYQSRDPEILRQVKTHWGTLREGRNPAREAVLARMRDQVRTTPGDPFAGQKVFQRVCGTCHKIYGEGQEVGPDLTGVGRSDLEQLLSNVFDPNLVIGTAYQATTVSTADGRVLSGLVVEDSPQRLVLKLQGGAVETLPKDRIEERKLAEVSLMPEDLETQMTAQEVADLFAFLGLDKPPTDPTAKRLPGLSEPRPRPAAEDPR